jgi:hypothetical protein
VIVMSVIQVAAGAIDENYISNGAIAISKEVSCLSACKVYRVIS